MSIVECPNCRSTFNVNGEALRKDRVKLRCSVCAHVFTPKKQPSPSLEQEFESLLTREDTGERPEDIAWPEEGAQEDAVNVAPVEWEETQPESVIKEIDSILGSGEEIGTVEEPRNHMQASGGRSRRIMITVVTLLLILGGGLWFMREQLPFWPRQIEESSPDARLERGPYFDLPHDSITYELLNNHKEGPVLVIKGVVKKLSQRPVKSVMVQARVYDETQRLLATRNAYAGIIPDASEFTRQDSGDMDTLLAAEPRTLGILATSQDIPFVVAFFGRPAREGQSFQVEVKEFHWQ